MTDAEANRYVDEQRESARLVGLDPHEVPRTGAEIHRYYRRMRPDLRVTKVARDSALWGFNPPMPRWVTFGTPAKPLFASVVAISAAMLPRWSRRLYGLPGLPTTDLAASIAGRSVRQALLALPADARESPYHRAARDRLAC